MSTPNGEPQNSSPSHNTKDQTPLWKNPYFLVPIIVAIISCLATVIPPIIASPTPAPTSTPDVTSWYHFEEGPMGWECERTAPDVRACQNVQRSTPRPHDGQFSLEIVMNLIPGDATKAKGEAFVSPVSVSTSNPLLANQTISAWVYLPKEAVGDPNNPNGVHLFVKDMDDDWRSLYGCWYRATEGWMQIWLTVSTDDPQCPNGGWYMQPGFDPTNIRAIGVAMGTPETDPDPAFAYQGSIYIDQVDW